MMSLTTTESIERLLEAYGRYSAGQPVPKEIQQIKAELELTIRQNSMIREKCLLVEASVGVGQLAEIPWLAIMDARETGTVQRGVSIVFLFRKDMGGFYLCLCCGSAEYRELPNGSTLLGEKARQVRLFCEKLKNRGFTLGKNIDLRSDGELALAFKQGTAVCKFYERNKLPSSDGLFEDLRELIEVYSNYVDNQIQLASSPRTSISTVQTEDRPAWIFQIDPNVFDINSALRVRPEVECVVSKNADQLAVGHQVYLWRMGADNGLIASATITGEVELRKPLNTNLMFYKQAEYADNMHRRIMIKTEKVFERPITLDAFLADPVLKDVVARPGNSGNFRLSPAEHQIIESMWRAASPELAAPQIQESRPVRSGDYVAPPLEEIIHRIKSAGIRLDERLIRRYHLALHSRGFVILAGMSGTGKTWLAQAYADAVAATYELVCVAPNWNSNEHLLGRVSPFKSNEYIDTSFSTFLRRASDAYLNATEVGLNAKPFHVVLDEMNLARVEYYFAIFLSKMEERSRAGVASLRLGQDEVLLTPNLFFIGTVNIDETTHGFSDKVFDRAQLIELEATEDLIEEHIGDRPYGEQLMTIWRILQFVAPFSFRVIDDIIAYVDHAELVSASWLDAFDEQVTQKILPKMRGKDPGAQEALRKLADYCEGKLPFTYRKTQAMIAALEKNGDISFFT